MKKLLFSNILIWLLYIISYSQVDTISTNIYQNGGNLGIGTKMPENALSIVGDETDWPGRVMFSINNINSGFKSLAYIEAKAGPSGNHTILGHISKTYTANDSPEDLQDFGILSANGKGLIIGATKNDQSPGIIKFCSGQSSGTTLDERMRINADGNVGIGTKNPLTPLDVNGGLRIGYSTQEYGGTLRWTGDDFEGYTGTSWVSLTEQPSVNNNWLSNGNNIYFNTGNVGIGTKLPENALSIIGDETDWPGRVMFSINNINSGFKSLAYIEAKAGPSGNHTILGHISKTYTANDSPEDLQDFGILSANGEGLIIGATKNDQSPGIIKFCSGQSSGTTLDERMRINADGNVGIGTSSPVAKLQVTDGDIFISDIQKGIIMKSPSGQCWRGTINDSGILEFKAVDCPDMETKKQSTSLENTALNQNIKIFPNPTSGVLNIETGNYEFSKINYSIIDLSGKAVQKGKITSSTSVVNIESLNPGIYLFEMKDHNKLLASEKISVQ